MITYSSNTFRKVRPIMNEPIETLEYRGYQITIYPDTDCQSLNEDGDDSLFLVHYHGDFWIEPKDKDKRPLCSRNALGYIMTNNADDYDKESAEAILRLYHVFPVAAYIHSGVSLSLEGSEFPDQQWDVSHVGAVLASKKEWRLRKSAYKCAASLVKSWNNYLSGNVYGYMAGTADDASCIDSCWGFYGDYDGKNASGMVEEAQSSIDHYITDERKLHTA
jgi:hypothetical protein